MRTPRERKHFEEITRNYNWPGITRDVVEIIKRCEVYHLQLFSIFLFETLKTVANIAQPGIPDIPQYPNEKVSLDTLGPLPLSKGYKYILVIQDYLTRYVVIVPLVTWQHSAPVTKQEIL